MSVLTDNDRFEVWADIMRKTVLSIQLDESVPGITKSELRAAVDAIDDWIDANASSFNTTIPQPARSALNVSQKAALLSYVVTKRFIKGV